MFLGLAALKEIADQAYQRPVEPTMQLRALLALLHLQSDGDLARYRDFWEWSRRPLVPGYVEPQNGTRGTYTATMWKAIARSCGFEPQSMAFCEAVRRMLEARGTVRKETGGLHDGKDCGWL